MPIKKHQGIALIQVLIITIILAMLGIYISQTVRSQVSTASLIKQSQQSILALESAEAELIHLLTTNSPYPTKNTDTVTDRWNFFGKPFKLNEQVTVTLQDVSGLLSINHIDRTLATNLFHQLGKKDEQIRVFLDSLADWKDQDDLKHLNGAESSYYEKVLEHGPRNSYLQTFAEIALIKEGHILTVKQWQQYFSLALISSFNPRNAPKALLKAYLNDERIFQEVLTLRNNNQLSGPAFYQATGIDEDDFISFRAGRIFNIKLETSSFENNINKTITIELQASSTKRPVLMTNITWNNT